MRDSYQPFYFIYSYFIYGSLYTESLESTYNAQYHKYEKLIYDYFP